MTHDPIRLLDDATVSGGLRRDLAAAARHRAPYDVGAGAARFEASLAKGAGAASSGWGAGALGLGALILGGLIGAGVWLSRPAAPAGDPAPAGSGVVAALPAVPLADVSPDMSKQPVVTAPAEGAGAAPAGPDVDVVRDMSEGAGLAGADTPEEPAPASAKKPRIRRGGAGRPEAAAASDPGAADYLREARSLQAARRLLEREPSQALARAEAGAVEFKAGAFAQEWEGVAILALFALDRRTEAERRANAFLARYPNGPYAAQIREAQVRP